MKNILRGIGIIAALLVAFMLLTSCAPGKAQTRTTNDGAAAHNFDGDKQPAAKSGYTSDEDTYGSSDDFDIENNDVDAASEPRQADAKPAVKSAAPKKTAVKKPAVEESSDAVEADERECAVHLVQMCAARLDLCEIAGAAHDAFGIALQRLIGALERQIDFAPDPGKETGVESGVRIHGITSRPT